MENGSNPGAQSIVLIIQFDFAIVKWRVHLTDMTEYEGNVLSF